MTSVLGVRGSVRNRATVVGRDAAHATRRRPSNIKSADSHRLSYSAVFVSSRADGATVACPRGHVLELSSSVT
jgi:hypothetical protein